jgi:hypothetical protein
LGKLNKVHLGKVQANGVIINRADKRLYCDVGIATMESALALPGAYSGPFETPALLTRLDSLRDMIVSPSSQEASRCLLAVAAIVLRRAKLVNSPGMDRQNFFCLPPASLLSNAGGKRRSALPFWFELFDAQNTNTCAATPDYGL